MFLGVIEALLADTKTLVTDLPAQGVVTLMEQKDEHRYVNHILYASHVKRGGGIEIIEDVLPVYNVNVTLRLDKAPKKVYLAPEMKEIDYRWDGKELSYTLDELFIHAMVVVEY